MDTRLSEHPEADNLTVADKARVYVAARRQLLGADKGGLMPALLNVDMAWHELHQACGYPCDDEDDC
jgi:hypothetical protein